MTTLSLLTAVAPRTGKIIKNGLSVFERENLLPMMYLYFVLGQSSEIVSQS